MIGAGHAGCEAASASARMGMRTLLLTLNLDHVAQMSCNPAIGGVGKGQMVREIDALGGVMGRAIDAAGIQFRMLNRSKGPAVHSPRAQADKKLYQDTVRRMVEQTPELDLRQGQVVEILLEGDRVAGVGLQSGRRYACRALIITPGTFLNGLIHLGDANYPGGRSGEISAPRLSDSLREKGFRLGRMKTGTPPRIHRRSIDFDGLAVQYGDEPPAPFSHFTEALDVEQVTCWTTHTTGETHRVIRENMHRSPLYSGRIRGVGPRYCPSIEDKVVKFPDRPAHHIWIEPEGRATDEMYINGLSTSLPEEVQMEILATVPGLAEAEMLRPGYAVEYDFVHPDQLHPNLETKLVARALPGRPDQRHHRLRGGGGAGVAGRDQRRAPDPGRGAGGASPLGSLRGGHDRRPGDPGHRGAVPHVHLAVGVPAALAERQRRPAADGAGRAAGPGDRRGAGRLVGETAADCRGAGAPAEPPGSPCIGSPRRFLPWKCRSSAGRALEDLLRRPEMNYPGLAVVSEAPLLPEDLGRRLEIEVKYEGYIRRELDGIERRRDMEDRRIPEPFWQSELRGVSNQGREALLRVRPQNVGQASRVRGVSPADVGVILVRLKEFGGAGKNGASNGSGTGLQ